MKIYTKRGDNGTTGVYRGKRVAKSAPQIEINGAVDEAQAFIGLARSELINDDRLNDILMRIEKDLWVLMAEVATENSTKVVFSAGVDQVSESMVNNIEQLIDEFMSAFKMPKEFVVPGGNRASAQLDVSRTVIRRAERVAVQHQAYVADSYIINYLNRLSDLLWALARFVENGSITAKEV